MKTRLITSAFLSALVSIPALAQHNQPDWSFTINVPSAVMQQQQIQQQQPVVVVPAPARQQPVVVAPAPVQRPVVQVLPPIPQSNDWQERDHQWRERDNFRNRMLENNRQVSQIINDRQDQQIDRIVEGVKSGRIGRDPFVMLMQNQKRLREVERTYLSDGFWARDEYEAMVRALDDEDRNIRRVAMGRGYRGQ
jgi:hypothetical protein